VLGPAPAGLQHRVPVVRERAVERVIHRLSGVEEGTAAVRGCNVEARVIRLGEMAGMHVAEADTGCTDAVVIAASLLAAVCDAPASKRRVFLPDEGASTIHNRMVRG
jgi:hypothetical protein